MKTIKCINHLYERFHELFRLDAGAGKLYWKVRAAKKIRIGQEAGCLVKGNGYMQVMVDGKLYRSHRIMWLMHYGSIDPAMDVDHINNIRHDNRIDNLRLVGHRENQSNRKDQKEGRTSSQYVGVYFDKHAKKWKAQIQINGKSQHLGLFTDERQAHLAYQQAMKGN
jgi:hypothetical protein